MTLKTDLYGLIQPLLDETTIWLDQSTPRPALPYVGMRINNRIRVKSDHYSDSDDDGVITISGDREFTLNVQRYGPDSVNVLDSLADNLRKITVIEAFAAKQIAVIETTGQALDISFSQDGIKYEPRASLDLRFRIRSAIADTVGYIDTVISNGTVNGEYAISSVSVTGD